MLVNNFLINHGPRGKAGQTENFVPWKFDPTRNDSKHRNARYPDKIFDFDYEDVSDSDEEEKAISDTTKTFVPTLVKGLIEYKHSGTLLDGPRINNRLSIYDEVRCKNIHIQSCYFLSVRRFLRDSTRFIFVCTLILDANKNNRKRDKSLNILYDIKTSSFIRFDLSCLNESNELERASEQDCEPVKKKLDHYVNAMEKKTDFVELPHIFHLPPSAAPDQPLAQVS